MFTNNIFKNETKIIPKYFDWLMNKIGFYKDPDIRPICIKLHEHPFVAVLSGDENRGNDGIELREKYLDEFEFTERDILSGMDYLSGVPTGVCSMFEMMVGLHERVVNEILYDYDEMLSCNLFDTMLKSLGVYDNDLEYILERFDSNDYDKDGYGGLFWTPCTEVDMRKTEIWYQMHIYFRETNYLNL